MCRKRVMRHKPGLTPQTEGKGNHNFCYDKQRDLLELLLREV